ncbi:hypothetical protein LCGC14_1979540, partial [marine sediment metagenome]
MLILFLIILLSSFSLGLAVYLRNPRRKINKVFFAFVLAVTVWLLSNYLQNEPIGLPLASLFLRIDFAVASLAAYFFLLFCLNFQRVHLLSSRLRELLALSPALALAILSFSDLIVTRIKFLNNTINFDLGGLYPLYTIYLFICVGIGCIDLIIKWRSSQGIERMQIFYLLLGFSLFGSIALPTNLFFQSLIAVKLFRIINYSFFFVITFTTHSILRYRLMDIRVVIRESTIYLLCSLAVLSFGLLLWFPLTRYLFLPPLVSLSLVLLGGAAVFRWIQTPTRKMAQKYFFAGLRQTEETVRFLSKKLTTLIDENKLVPVVLKTIINSFRLDKAGIILRKGTSNFYESKKLIGFRAKKLSLKASNFLIGHLNKIKSAEIKEELTLKIKDSSSKEETSRLIQLEKEMSKIEAEVCLALLSKGELGGILILGRKISGRPYSKQDLELLQTLANQAAIALDNARLYQEVKNWSKELGRKVKEKTEELKQSQTQLFQSEKLAGIGQLAAGIAHEIRNPLGIIATSLYYLNDVLPEKREDVERHLKIMGAEINRCESIINNLLEFSRKSTQEFELIDVNQLLNITLSLVEKDLFVKDIKLIKKFRHSPTIKANMDEMKQIFLNLILNATQAMPRGGRLEIATSITKNERARIKVVDSGTGISEKHLSQIFDPFFTTKAPGEGTGLGLTLVHNIIERWGGTIQVESQGVKGTTFTIEFPIPKEEP